jgi:hypothetical protein
LQRDNGAGVKVGSFCGSEHGVRSVFHRVSASGRLFHVVQSSLNSLLPVADGSLGSEPKLCCESPQTTSGNGQNTREQSRGGPARRAPQGFGWFLALCGLIGVGISYAYIWIVSPVDRKSSKNEDDSD